MAIEGAPPGGEAAAIEGLYEVLHELRADAVDISRSGSYDRLVAEVTRCARAHRVTPEHLLYQFASEILRAANVDDLAAVLLALLEEL